MVDLGVEIHALTQQLKTTTEEAVNDYLDSKDFKADTRVTWAHDFESMKRRFKKFQPDLALPPYNLLDYTSVVVEYSEYDENSYIQKGETSSGATMQTSIDVGNKA